LSQGFLQMAVKKKSQIPSSVGCPLVLGLLALCTYLLWTLVSTIVSDWRSAQPSLRPSTEELPSKEQAMATLINFNGELCARVDLIAPTNNPDEFTVFCQEYGNARKSHTKKNVVVYKVNMNSGTATLLGRG
jgi:hypothetical protein